jgi:hypothetical protein
VNPEAPGISRLAVLSVAPELHLSGLVDNYHLLRIWTHSAGAARFAAFLRERRELACRRRAFAALTAPTLRHDSDTVSASGAAIHMECAHTGAAPGFLPRGSCIPEA